jgi:hypothetical protein
MKIDIKSLWMIVEKSTKKVLFPTHSFVRKSGAWSYLSGKNNGIKIHELKSMYDVKSVYDIMQNNA